MTDLPSDQLSDRGSSPRNPWTRIESALSLMQARDGWQCLEEIERLRYHPELSDELLDVYRRLIADHCPSPAPQPLNNPADYLTHADPRLLKPFRQCDTSRSVPSPYPPSMALPAIPGEQNDIAFLRDAAAALGEDLAPRIQRVRVVLGTAPDTNVGTLARRLARQRGPLDLRLTICTHESNAAATSLPAELAAEVIPNGILGTEARDRMRRIIDEEADLVVFLDGRVELDESFLDRILYLARVSDNLLQPLVASRDGGPLRSLFTDDPKDNRFRSRYPFREMQGLNFATSAALLRRTGLPDPRFAGTQHAARELAFRAFMLGAYFSPISVPDLSLPADAQDNAEDQRLYQSLCPNHWDRKADGRFDRPRVSIYIPAYNAHRFLGRAIDSALRQDVTDLEVCIANDGSVDGTAELLERRYGNEPRVRWTNGRNGGIGYASNRAIEHSRAPYIGQLDSDDVLKPGAVRRLMEYLDEHPDVVCCYGSCERINEQGAFVQDEYSWPVFSREKMMITSIVHHFRMFRRAAWERTRKFREDLENAIDYDIYLKLSETGKFHHIEEVLYQRRWHGQNTSLVNEDKQTANTYRAQREALKRLGLEKFWQIHVPDADKPRRVTYRRAPDVRTVLFWPDYSRSNPYQRMLYGQARQHREILAGDIDAALDIIDEFADPGMLTFHLHWLNFVLRHAEGMEDAYDKADDFHTKLERFVAKGGKLVWTIHNVVSHDTDFQAVELDLSARIARLAHVLHFHSEASVAEVAASFPVPQEKVRISRHGSYVGVYPDFVARDQARARLGLSPDDDVIVFSGQVRQYKGVEQLVTVFRRILARRPNAMLLLAGDLKFDLFGSLEPELTPSERSRILATERFLGELEMQLFFKAADLAVYPYQKVLTSGSLLLALSFGTPVVIPAVGMARDVLEGKHAGELYSPDAGEKALESAIDKMLEHKSRGALPSLSRNALAVANALPWPDFEPLL